MIKNSELRIAIKNSQFNNKPTKSLKNFVTQIAKLWIEYTKPNTDGFNIDTVVDKICDVVIHSFNLRTSNISAYKYVTQVVAFHIIMILTGPR